MNKQFPVQLSWTLVHPMPKLTSSVTSASLRKLQPLEAMPPEEELEIQPGIYGTHSAWTYTLTHNYKPSTTPHPYCKFLRITTEVAPWLPVRLKSVLERWMEPFVPLGRRLPHWAAQTLGYNPQENSTYAYPASSAPIKRRSSTIQSQPIPFPIFTHTAQLTYTTWTAHAEAIADMLLLRFFFLLRSGEYAHTSNPDATPFRLQDTHILINDRRLNYLICAKIELQAINYIGLEFTMQKNGERGDLVGLRHFGHPTWCPIEALINRVKHLH
jgi:hypothetical protein